MKIEFYNGASYEIVEFTDYIAALTEMEKRLAEAEKKYSKSVYGLRKVQDGEYTTLIGKNKVVYFQMRIID